MEQSRAPQPPAARLPAADLLSPRKVVGGGARTRNEGPLLVGRPLQHVQLEGQRLQLVAALRRIHLLIHAALQFERGKFENGRRVGAGRGRST